MVVIDFSVGFTHSEYPMAADFSSEVETTARLLEEARQQAIPAFFTTVAYEPSLADAGVWPQKIPGLSGLVLGTRQVEIDPRLGRTEREPVIVKKGASAFFGTNLAALLCAASVDTLIVCGATTSGCVRASVVDAVQFGFPTLVPSECVGDRARGPHDANLFDIQAKYADVVSLEEVLDYLAQLGKVTA